MAARTVEHSCDNHVDEVLEVSQINDLDLGISEML